MSKIKPVVKWSGSKRSQAESITRLIPAHKTYFEPFIGGASITYSVFPQKAVCGDICEPLIALWKLIQTSPEELADSYAVSWNRLQKEGHEVYYEIRDRFNKNQNGWDLLFLSRTCVNGLIRFNQDGDFNNSLHHTRPGINPDTLKTIIFDWSSRLKNVTFVCADYRKTTEAAGSGDFVYLDPPYFNTQGRYYGTIDFEEFYLYLEDLNRRGVKFALSFDGTRGDVDYQVELPTELYRQHILLPSGPSSFKKVMDGTREMVHESLYLNYE